MMQGKTKQMQTSALATLYTFALRTGEEQKMFSENFKSELLKVRSLTDAHRFIGLYGTHYMKKAKMGARY
jgi:MAC/Perforin domain